MEKIALFGQDLAEWGKNYTGNFKQRINYWKKQIAHYKGGRDDNSIVAFKNAEKGAVRSICKKRGVIDDIPSSVTPQQNDNFLANVTEEEIRKALFQIHLDTSPGPDGITPGFFQKCWHIVKQDVCSVVRSLFSDGTIPTGLNRTHIILVPKKKSPSNMGDLRPISLCNVLYKIISKVLSNRLKIKGIRVANGAPFISHMLFADDSYIFCRANENDSAKVLTLLKDFEMASRQMVNFSKSSVFFSVNTQLADRKQICQKMGIIEADDSSLYLGLPCIISRNKKVVFGFLKNKMCKKIQSWEVFLLPLNTCKSLENAMSNYWWKSSKQSSGVSWMRWKKLCKHKSNGDLGFKDLRDYNIALLGKQAWRLLVNDNALISKVFKARYFATGSFLTSSLGNNPTSVGRSIFETKQLMLAGVRKSIARGIETSILEDSWLPDIADPYVHTAHPSLVNEKVSSLICIDRHQWDEEILEDMFDARDHNLILSIPLPQTIQQDCWTWSKEKTWIYTVKSAYRWLQNHDVATGLDSDFWTAFWKINVQLKKNTVALDVVLSARSNLYQWQSAQQNRFDPLISPFEIGKEEEHWTKLVANMVKINVDGAIFEAYNSFEFGFIARDSFGAIIEAVTSSKTSSASPEIVELIGIKDALSGIKTKGWSYVVLETDCLMAVQAIHNNTFLPSTFGMLVHDCQHLISQLSNVNLSFDKRSANKAAYFLACSSCYFSDRSHMLEIHLLS
uniref:RNase H type-1 domain-containing protein n=1 Tax=Cannabis sativa TaxID=3483 RepID=A0A803NJC2_CANSA